MTSSPSGANFINKKLPSDLGNSKFYGVKMEPNGTNAKGTGKNRVRTTMNRADGEIKCNKKIRIDTDCQIINTEGVRCLSRTAWPAYRYHQVDETWQRNACIRMGLQFREVFQCQDGGTNVILTRPIMSTLQNVYGDGNCLFRAFSY